MATGLDPERADRLLAMAAANIDRDHPLHWTHMVDSPADLRPQRDLHPVFPGSYDWHSCVHQTWLAVRLLRLYPDLPSAPAARSTLDARVTPGNVAVEAAFFTRPHSASWERPYGWAWLLLLAAELRAADSPLAPVLAPLTTTIRALWLDWLPRTPRPIRVGTHTNTAFALALALDAARSTGDGELAAVCESAAHRLYGSDEDTRGFEPDAADFLSPTLAEADLMRRVLPPDAFAPWLDRFVTDLTAPRWATLTSPFPVDDPADPHGSHLAGLALSRAWAWRGVADALPEGHRYRALAADAAEQHARAGWDHVFGHGYAAEHWLGTFAAYLAVGALGDHPRP